ncbi:MAG: NIL domain-containing protein [Bacteroidota bacterium]
MTQRFILTFPTHAINEPVVYHLITDYSIKINIFNAYINSGEECNLALEMDASRVQIDQARSYLNDTGIVCEPLDKKIAFKSEACIHCGSCTAVCYSGALKMDKPDWKLQFDASSCTVCELCTTACPLKLFYIDFVE